MKNVTIKIDNDVAHWSRVWAAENDTSVSQIIGDMLKQLKREKTGYNKAMQQFLSANAHPLKSNQSYPLRDDLHER
ncbi:MAG: hypothetical protein L3J46_03055 [Kangiellaceae bacterium]|nr:hypothetical protein [Kangiellaceae bacterium]